MNPGDQNSVAQSALLTIAMRWASRLVGIASTLILARLLVPEDFGITAMASMVLGIASMFVDIGVNVALIRNVDATADHYHSAWTLRLAQAVLIALILITAAPFAGVYFHDPRVTPVLIVVALSVPISSLENIGVVTFQKNMQFGLEFRYQLTNRLAGFLFVVGAALLMRNYWALVIGSTAGQVFGVLNSYRVHPMRPRLGFKKAREILSFSQWMLLQNIGGYLDGSLHKILVGRRDSTAAMGAYTLADGIAAMPSSELMQPLNRVLFPAFVAAKHDLAELKRIFLLAQSLQVLIALPAAVFMSLLAADLVPVLLGPKWTPAVPLLRTLALGSAMLAFRSSAWYVSITLGRERWSALVDWAQGVAFVVLCFVIYPGALAQQIAEFRVLVPVLGLVFQLLICARALGNLSVGDLWRAIWRPVAAIALSAAALELLPIPALALPLVLALKCIVCGVVYLSSVLLLWWASGTPNGAERYLWDRASGVFAGLRSRYV